MLRQILLVFKFSGVSWTCILEKSPSTGGMWILNRTVGFITDVCITLGYVSLFLVNFLDRTKL
jgi:hypothetical protein